MSNRSRCTKMKVYFDIIYILYDKNNLFFGLIISSLTQAMDDATGAYMVR
jgi:hypothetical protein